MSLTTVRIDELSQVVGGVIRSSKRTPTRGGKDKPSSPVSGDKGALGSRGARADAKSPAKGKPPFGGGGDFGGGGATDRW